jgi:diaminopimelate decarboxylase
MNVRPDRTEIARYLCLARDQGLLGAGQNAAIFYSRDHLVGRMQLCRTAFPAGALHTIAIKALPFPRLLRHFCAAGYGAEVASHGELEIALATGFASADIVFDSPAKTRYELEYALSLGCHVNADNFDELERIAAILDRRPDIDKPSIGLRINPQVGTGSIISTSVAGEYSKFGVPLKEQADRIVEFYKRHAWLNSVHCHIGSQGCSIEMLVNGAAEIDKLIRKIESNRAEPIRNIDIGGGLPAAYRFGDNDASFDTYASALFSKLPHWRSTHNGPRLITEFGRHFAANAAWAVSNIEYVKPSAGLHTAVSHLGADMFLRKCYRPDDWYHEISVYDAVSDTFFATGNNTIRVAGPLCFAGDIIGEVQTAEVPTDKQQLIVHDVGAYTVSMWSRYNSRYMPAIFEYDTATQTILIVKQAETAQDLIAFWS